MVFGLIYGLIAGLGGAAVIMRAQALSFIHKPYIEASRVAGAGGQQVIFKHLIPNMLPLAAVQMLVGVTGAVFADGFSTFLGLSRTRLNWGSMIYDSFTYQAVNAAITWNVLIPSALAISLFAAAFYMIARGVHEVADPRLRAREAAPAAKKVKASRSAQVERPVPEMPAASEAIAQATLEDTAPVRLARPSPLHLEDPAAFAWLEFLAARQGVVEGLLLAPHERCPSPPEWVQTTGMYAPISSQAATPAEETAQAGLAQARQSLQQGATALALGHYQRLIQAKLLLPEIVQDLSQAIELYPAEFALWQALGDAHLRRGNFQLALEAYHMAERLFK
jgi:tetratricopeptide (TPR) repeat protein